MHTQGTAYLLFVFTVIICSAFPMHLLSSLGLLLVLAVYILHLFSKIFIIIFFLPARMRYCMLLSQMGTSMRFLS
jgi:hypothetical protein